jgi:hypothetical protein
MTKTNGILTREPTRRQRLESQFLFFICCAVVSIWEQLGARTSFEQRALVGRVGDVGAPDTGEGGQFVLLGSSSAHNFKHANTSDTKGIGNERTMATPGHGFGTHQCRRAGFGQGDGAIERGREFRSLHVIGIAAKTRIAPTEIHRISARRSQAAEFFQVNIADAGGAKRSGQSVGVELRIVTRLGDGADVDELPDTMGVEELKESLDRAGGVADGENRWCVSRWPLH